MKTTMSAKNFIISRIQHLNRDKEVLSARLEELQTILEGLNREEDAEAENVKAVLKQEAPF